MTETVTGTADENDLAARDGRVALVVGGAGAIGGASCERLALMGCVVALVDIDLAAAERKIAELPGSRHRAFAADAASEDDIEALFDKVEAEVGPVAIVLYVAGGPCIDPKQPQRIADTSVEVWERAHRLNAQGLFYAVRAFLRRRRERPVEHGRVITIGSMAGVAPMGLHTGVSYSAAKASATNLTRYVALEAAPLGITANAIAPGTILTETVRKAMTQEQRDAVAARTPMGRLGRPENIASAVAYFAERDADFTSGCVLEVNGASHMG